MQKLAMRDSGEWSIFSGKGSYQYSDAFLKKSAGFFLYGSTSVVSVGRRGKKTGCGTSARAHAGWDLLLTDHSRYFFPVCVTTAASCLIVLCAVVCTACSLEPSKAGTVCSGSTRSMLVY